VTLRFHGRFSINGPVEDFVKDFDDLHSVLVESNRVVIRHVDTPEVAHEVSRRADTQWRVSGRDMVSVFGRVNFADYYFDRFEIIH
jgi:hypothetical protein